MFDPQTKIRKKMSSNHLLPQPKDNQKLRNPHIDDIRLQGTDSQTSSGSKNDPFNELGSSNMKLESPVAVNVAHTKKVSESTWRR